MRIFVARIAADGEISSDADDSSDMAHIESDAITGMGDDLLIEKGEMRWGIWRVVITSVMEYAENVHFKKERNAVRVKSSGYHIGTFGYLTPAVNLVSRKLSDKCTMGTW